ncbi:MAG: extracellular solute-binding protein [Lachnospiraceae bacterium]
MEQKKTETKVLFISAVLVTAAAILLMGCGVQDKKEKTDSISVYLWSNALYNTYAPYIQSQLPDVDIDFIVGNNDLDFYKFLNEHGALPDIITTRRFSLHDAAELKDQLMDLSTTEEAGAVYQTYLENFTNADGTVNWLPLCGEADGLVANRALFDKYGIPLPTDYESFVSACKAFEEVGIRGFVADFTYDYTCMEILQALSIPELTSMEGQIWRHNYEDPSNEAIGLDDNIWPAAFERMEQFIKDTHLVAEDVKLSYTPVVKMFQNGEAAIMRAGGGNVVALSQDENLDPVFLPYFGQNGEQWLLTYPAFQVALNKNLEKDKKRQEQALQVLSVMLSENGQNMLAGGYDVISYSQNVSLELAPELDNLTPLIKQNRLYIRIASNDFFSVSRDVVQKMIQGEYDAKQAYEAFDAQLKQSKTVTEEIVATFEKSYSNEFRKNGGKESFSVMANSLRKLYGSDVLVAPATAFTGSVLKADYTKKMAGFMIMPNALDAWRCEMTGAQLKDYIKRFVEGKGAGFVPFNRGSLPVVSGITIEVKETDGAYILERVLKDGKEISDEDTFLVSCINPSAFMGSILVTEGLNFVKEDKNVRNAWTAYILDGGTLEEPENYIILK